MPTLEDVLKVYRKKVIGWEELENEFKGFLENLIDTTQRMNYGAQGFFAQTKIDADANDTFNVWTSSAEKNGTNGSVAATSPNFTDATAAVFTADDVGKLIRVTGSTNSDGVYKIISVTSTTVVVVDRDFGNTESSLSWELNRPVACNCRHDLNFRIVELVNEKFYDINRNFDSSKNPLCYQVPFLNSTGQTYSVGIKRISIPYDLELNPRNAQSYYRSYRETIGETGDPDNAEASGGGIEFEINDIFGSGTIEDHSGIKARVWLKNPLARTVSEAIEEVTITYSGGKNKVTTSGKLGQAIVSTTASDYQVAIESISWRDKANKDLSTDPDYAYVGKITGNGPSAIPVGFDTTTPPQIVFGSDVIDTLNINQLAKDIYSGGIGDLGGDGIAKFTHNIEDWIGTEHYGPSHATWGKHKDITFDNLWNRSGIAGTQIAFRAKDVADESVIKMAIRDNGLVDRIKFYPNGNIVADGNLTIGDGTDNISTFNGKVIGGANGFFGANTLSFYDDIGILEDKRIYLGGQSGGSYLSGIFIEYESSTNQINIVANESGTELVLVTTKVKIGTDAEVINDLVVGGDVDVGVNVDVDGNTLTNVGGGTPGVKHRTGSFFKTLDDVGAGNSEIVADPAAQDTTFTEGYYHVCWAIDPTGPKSAGGLGWNNELIYIGEGDSAVPGTSSTMSSSKLWIDRDDGNKMKVYNGEGSAKDYVFKIFRPYNLDTDWVIT